MIFTAWKTYQKEIWKPPLYIFFQNPIKESFSKLLWFSTHRKCIKKYIKGVSIFHFKKLVRRKDVKMASTWYPNHIQEIPSKGRQRFASQKNLLKDVHWNNVRFFPWKLYQRNSLRWFGNRCNIDIETTSSQHAVSVLNLT